MESYFPTVTGARSHEARERVLEDLRILTSDAEMLLKATVGDLGDRAIEARQRLEAGLARAKVTLAEFQERSMASVQAAARRADTTIRDHPYESVGIALGIGILVGFVLNRE